MKEDDFVYLLTSNTYADLFKKNHNIKEIIADKRLSRFNLIYLFSLMKKIKKHHTDKEGKTIILYTSNIEEQDSYIKQANKKGYTVLLLDSPIVSHLIQKLETTKEKISFARTLFKESLLPGKNSEKNLKFSSFTPPPSKMSFLP